MVHARDMSIASVWRNFGRPSLFCHMFEFLKKYKNNMIYDHIIFQSHVIFRYILYLL